jgi:hypothetical protein
MLLFGLPKRFLLFLLVLESSLFAQPERIFVASTADLQACVDRPAGQPLVCALRASPQPYSIAGATLTIRRSDTTVEGAGEPGQDPPTLKRADPLLKKMILVHKFASNVTIRNVQIDGNSSIAPDKGFQDLSVEGSNVTVEGNYFGDSTYYAVFFGGPHFSLHHNTFGKLIKAGVSVAAPGINCAIKAWGGNAAQFSIESNTVIGYQGGPMSLTGVPGGTDSALASVVRNNTLYHNEFCVPDCGGGQIYLAGTSNVKVTDNTIDGGWAESNNREIVHSYGIEIDDKASYIYIGSNKILNNSISGIWIGNGSHDITIENNTVYNNGLNGVQIAGNGRLAPVSAVSILGLNAHDNDRHRSPRAPYPTLPRFWGVMIQNGGASKDVCIQSGSNLATNAKGAVYSEGSYSRSASCPRPYN